MSSQMNAVHEAARLAMGDHRAADPHLRRSRLSTSSLHQRLLISTAAGLLLVILTVTVLAR
jgi:hypothetical protein